MDDAITKITPRLLLFDLDGTLLDSRKRISPKNLEAIEKCRRRGIMIGIATARSEATCKRFADAIQPDLLISNSGALVRLCGTVIYECGFSPEESSILVRAGVAEQRGITVDCADVTFSNRYISTFNEPGIVYTDYENFSRNCFKICIEGNDREFAEKTSALVKNCSWLAFSDCNWFKFSRSGVSKGDALRHVSDKTGIPAESMVAFGDDYVDVEMLAVCGVGVAMGNAVDDVRQHADIVIGSNDTDAISAFIYRYIL